MKKLILVTLLAINLTCCSKSAFKKDINFFKSFPLAKKEVAIIQSFSTNSKISSDKIATAIEDTEKKYHEIQLQKYVPLYGTNSKILMHNAKYFNKNDEIIQNQIKIINGLREYFNTLLLVTQNDKTILTQDANKIGKKLQKIKPEQLEKVATDIDNSATKINTTNSAEENAIKDAEIAASAIADVSSVAKGAESFIKSVKKLGVLLDNKKEIKDLTPIIIDMDDSISKICDLLIHSIGNIPSQSQKGQGLRGKYWSNYQQTINGIYINSANKNKTPSFAHKQYQINLLISTINNQQNTEKLLIQAQNTLKQIKNIHNILATNLKDDSKSKASKLNALISQLVQNNSDIQKYLDGFDV